MSYPARRPWRRASQQQSWDPFNELAVLRGQMARMLQALSGARGTGDWFGDVDLDEDEKGWTVTARLPGVAPDEVLVEVEDRDLCIRGRSEGQETDEGRTTSRLASFNYRLTLPSDADTEQVDATMDHGLLTIRLPRSARSRRRAISIGHGTPGGQPAVTSGTAQEPASGTAMPPDESTGSGG